jgi:hypothetical protein
VGSQAMNWSIQCWSPTRNAWYPLCGAQGPKTWIQGLWAGLTDYCRTGDRLRLLDGSGSVVDEKQPSALQVGMQTYPSRARLEHALCPFPCEHPRWKEGP